MSRRLKLTEALAYIENLKAEIRMLGHVEKEARGIADREMARTPRPLMDYWRLFQALADYDEWRHTGKEATNVLKKLD